MKKVLGLLFASTLAFGIAGCGKDDEKEEEKVVTFAEYLETSEGLTVNKLNETVGPISFEMDGYLTQLDIQNTKMSLTQGSETLNYYMWGGTEGTGEDAQKYVYGAMPGETANEFMVAKINLDTMDEFIDGMKEGILSNSPIDMEDVLVDTDDSGTVEISEVIDNVLGLTGTVDTETINVASVLSKIDFDINDFEDKGNGVYKLKLSALVDIVADITGEEVPEDVNNQITAMDEMLQVEVKYAENHINEVKLSVNVLDEEEGVYSSTQNTTMTLGLEYSENEVSKTTVSVVNTSVDTFVEDDETYTSYSAMNLVVSDNEVSLTFKTGETALNVSNIIEFSSKVENAKTTLKLKVTTEGQVVGEMTLGVVGNWLSDLTITTAEMTISIESNVNVVIPADIKALEAYDMTETILEAIAGAMNPDDDSVAIA